MARWGVACAFGLPAKQTSLSRNSRTSWLAVVLFSWLVVFGLNGQVHAAGCAHAQAVVHSAPLGSLEPALAGHWQYIGGKSYYVFEATPMPCEGPGCRQAPEPTSEMGVVPATTQQTYPSAALLTELVWQDTDGDRTVIAPASHAIQPTLAGLLRPPCALIAVSL